MSTTVINTGDWVGTKAQYIALSSISANKKYYITDLETFVITNASMVSALTTYSSLYNIGDVFLCIDSGTYTQNTFYKFNSNSWIDIGKLITSADIPTVNDGTLTIQKNGTQVATFTANQSGNTTANIETLTYDEINPAGTINPFDDYYNKSQTVNLISNPNLLINGDLSVNQRGQTTYSGANKYTADRWQQGSGTFDYSTKTWTPSTQYSGFVQKVEDVDKFKGQTVTISAKINSVSNTSGFDLLINDGSNHRSSITFTGAGVRSFTYTVSTTATQLRFGFIYLGTATTDTLSFEWVKVEMGEIATPFSPRPYAEELAMCQRYYIGSTVEAKALRLNTPAFMATSATQVYMLCKLPVTMRTTPTLIVNTLPTIRGSGINQTISNIAIFDAIRPDGIMFLVTSSGLTSYNPYALFNGYIQLDAEIY